MIRARLVFAFLSFSVSLPAAAKAVATPKADSAAQACLDLGLMMEHGGSGGAINRLAEQCVRDAKAGRALAKKLTDQGYLVPSALNPHVRQIASYQSKTR